MKALLVIISMLAATYSYACSEPGCTDAPPGKPVAGSGKFREPSSKKKHRRAAKAHRAKKHAKNQEAAPAADAAAAAPAAAGEPAHH